MIDIINRFKTLTYNIGFIKKELFDIQNTSLTKNDIVWMKHNYKDRYFADPFLIDENEQTERNSEEHISAEKSDLLVLRAGEFHGRNLM